MKNDIGGVLLAGGLSRRMGGGDKALLPLAGRSLIEHAAERLAPQVSSLIVNANGDASRFAFLDLPVVPDETADFPGPLAGVLAGLHWFARARPDARAVASVSADAPFIPRDLVVFLDQALSAHPEAGVAIAKSHGRRHHVIGLWRMSAAGKIEDALARSERKVETMVDSLGAIAIAFPDYVAAGKTIDPFFNINTPEDLVFAESVLAQDPSREPHND